MTTATLGRNDDELLAVWSKVEPVGCRNLEMQGVIDPRQDVVGGNRHVGPGSNAREVMGPRKGRADASLDGDGPLGKMVASDDDAMNGRVGRRSG